MEKNTNGLKTIIGHKEEILIPVKDKGDLLGLPTVLKEFGGVSLRCIDTGNLEKTLRLQRVIVIHKNVNLDYLNPDNIYGTMCQKEYRADFKNVNLSNFYLGKSDFRGADFRGANLINSDIRDAYLRSYFEDTTLWRANLRGSDLNDAKLNRADLGGALFADAKLNRADLGEANLCEADFRRAGLEKSNLRGARLRGTDFRDANLRKAYFGEVNFRGTKLEGADLEGAKFGVISRYD